MNKSPEALGFRKKLTHQILSAVTALSLLSAPASAQDPEQLPVPVRQADAPAGASESHVLFMPAVQRNPTEALPDMEATVDVEQWRSELSQQLSFLGIQIPPEKISIDITGYSAVDEVRFKKAFTNVIEMFLSTAETLKSQGILTPDEISEVTRQSINSLTIAYDATLKGAKTGHIQRNGVMDVYMYFGPNIGNETGAVANELAHLLLNMKEIIQLHPELSDVLAEFMSTTIHLLYLLRNYLPDDKGLVGLTELEQFIREVRTSTYGEWSLGTREAIENGPALTSDRNSLSSILSMMRSIRQGILKGDPMISRLAEGTASETTYEVFTEPRASTLALEWIFKYLVYTRELSQDPQLVYDEQRHGPIPRILNRQISKGRLPSPEEELLRMQDGMYETAMIDTAGPWGGWVTDDGYGGEVQGTPIWFISMAIGDETLRTFTPPSQMSISWDNPDIIIDGRQFIPIDRNGSDFGGYLIPILAVTNIAGIPIPLPNGTVLTLTSERNGTKIVHKAVYDYLGVRAVSASVRSGDFVWPVDLDVMPQDPDKMVEFSTGGRVQVERSSTGQE